MGKISGWQYMNLEPKFDVRLNTVDIDGKWPFVMTIGGIGNTVNLIMDEPMVDSFIFHLSSALQEYYDAQK